MARVTHVVVERVADCPFSVAHDYAEEFLQDAERAVEVRIPLRNFFYGLRGHVARPVKLLFALHPDETEGGRLHDALLIEWRAGTRLFPHFHGTLRLRIADVEHTRLTFEGAYRPPAGALGLVFDALLGRRIAKSTMAELLDRIARALERREEEYRQGLLTAQGSGTGT
ncbi:MAG TPA: hypothetical protein VMD91_10275 [Candidatus Sulfotelmatobacter sp.]|nr:hypothetical protein [Candidatus Sulfotelmatobacter sp.]